MTGAGERAARCPAQVLRPSKAGCTTRLIGAELAVPRGTRRPRVRRLWDGQALGRQAGQSGLSVHSYGSPGGYLGRLMRAVTEQLPALDGIETKPSKFRPSKPGESEGIADRFSLHEVRLVPVKLGSPREELFGYDMGLLSTRNFSESVPLLRRHAPPPTTRVRSTGSRSGVGF